MRYLATGFAIMVFSIVFIIQLPTYDEYMMLGVSFSLFLFSMAFMVKGVLEITE